MWIFIKRLAAVNDVLKELGTPKLYRKTAYTHKTNINWMVSV